MKRAEAVTGKWNGLIGRVVEGKYEIIRLVNINYGTATFIACDQRIGKIWRLKVCERNSGKERAIIESGFMAEHSVLKRLNHPAIPQVVAVITENQYIYVLMEYMEGEELENIVEKKGPQPAELVIEWAKQICEILRYLHSQQPPIIHRDIKPHNILVTPNGPLKLVKFGTMGQTDARTDIYGLGMTMYRLVTGENPCEFGFSQRLD